MEFLSALSGWQWAVLLAVPPLVVMLYFLKLRRQPLEVPSTFLWKKSIEDLHVNALWQRIRQSLLLYLQLLLLLLVILALLRPGWRSTKKIDERRIFLIDNSASMSATDVSPSRLEEAKRQVIAKIDEMSGSDQALVVSFSDVARVEQGWTSARRDLRQAVEDIKPTDRPTAIGEALQVAAGLANPSHSAEYGDNRVSESQPAKLYILSDGKFPPVQGFSLGSLEPVFIPIGQANASNLAIVAFSVRRNEERENQLQAFGSVQNFGDEAVKAPVDLFLNGKPLDASQVQVGPHQTAGVSFNIGDVEAGMLELKLGKPDDLAQDNRAWAAVNASRRPKVLLVTPGNDALELALSTPRAAELAEVSKAKPDVLKTKEHQKAAAGGAFDLIIYDRCQPVQLPRANTLFIGAVPPQPTEEFAQPKGASTSTTAAAKSKVDSAPTGGAAPAGGATAVAAPGGKWWSLGEPVVYPQIIDVDATHPLMQWVADLGDVDIAQARPVTAPSGGTKLMESNKGTLLAIAPREGFEDAVLGFEIYSVDKDGASGPNTTWQIRRSFPAFVFAVLTYLGGNEGTQAGETVKPGQPISIKTEMPVDQLTVRTPQGTKINVSRGKGGAFQFNDTDQLGPYEASDGAKLIERFSVNLFDPLESDIRPAKEQTIQIGNVSVVANSSFEPVRQETW
ncbi:MAG TPA: BatA and WFA domain-containing protein, partial [Pirellulales bacterium]